MKRFLAQTLTAVAFATLGFCRIATAQISPAPGTGQASNSFNGFLANESALTYNKTYTLDLSQYNASKFSAQVIYGTATVVSPTFTDGSQSTGTITINTVSGTPVGLSSAIFTMDGISLVQGTDWQIGTSSVTAARSLAQAIAANATLKTIVSVSSNTVAQPTANGGLGGILLTSLLNGTAYNYTMTTSTPTALGVVGMRFGTDPQFSLGGSIFTTSSPNQLTLGLPVQVSSITFAGHATSINSLGTNVTGITYFAVPITSSQFELALYSTGSLVSPPLNLFVVTSTTSQTQVGENTFTITPLISSGTASFVWQTSNDGVDWQTSTSTGTVTVWNSVGSSHATYFATSTVTTDSLVDFGVFNYRYIRLNATGAQGGLFLQVPVNIKQDGIGPF